MDPWKNHPKMTPGGTPNDPRFWRLFRRFGGFGKKGPKKICFLRPQVQTHWKHLVFEGLAFSGPRPPPARAQLRRTRYKYSACDSEHNSSDDGDYSYGNFYVASGEDIETKSESSQNNSISRGNNTPLPFNSHGNRARARTASHNTSNNSMDEYLGGFESRNIIEM